MKLNFLAHMLTSHFIRYPQPVVPFYNVGHYCKGYDESYHIEGRDVVVTDTGICRIAM